MSRSSDVAAGECGISDLFKRIILNFDATVMSLIRS
jgi:hypothetical protein